MDTAGITRSRSKTIIVLLLVQLILLPFTESGNLYPEFDLKFTDFLRENGYRGGAVAAMKDGRLLLARGYGHDRSGHTVSAFSKFPVSSIAKSLTGVAVIRLVEEELLSLDDKVFGDYGILDYIQPWRSSDVDPRLMDITVDHLLRHTAGWDNTQGPLYDPLFNVVYHDRGHKVPNIALEMGKKSANESLDPEELISYVISSPLHYPPGTTEIHSNVGYLILGRVVEAIKGVEYRDYIKRLILDPCGMWNTRLEMAHYVEDDMPLAADHDPSVMTFLDPVSIDSTLGWHSNVYDIMRFSRCLFHSKTLLGDTHLELLLAKSPVHPVTKATTWYGGGFRVSDKNFVWQDADLHTDDLILLHHRPSTNHPNQVDIQLDTDSKYRHLSTQDQPDSWVILLCDKVLNHLRHKSREIMATIQSSLLINNYENIFLYDLSELHRHPSWQPPKSLLTPQVTVRYKVDEHHLTAYVNALKAEGFSLHSFTSHTHHKHTLFLLVGKKSASSKSEPDFIFKHGMDHRQLRKTKLLLEDSDYNMTLLHSYKSQSHSQHYVFAALFKYEAFPTDMQMKYGTSHLPEPYEKLVQMYHEQRFHPLSETVVFQGKDERFSFIFVRKLEGSTVNFNQDYNLSPAHLGKLTMENANRNLHLSYLNAYTVAGKSRFSAVFTNETHYKGVLEIEQSVNHATRVTISHINNGLVPKQMVPYFNENDKEMKIAAYYEAV